MPSDLQIKKVWPTATNTVWMQGIVDELNKSYSVKGETKKLYEIFDLNTCLKRAHFFAQAFVESNTDLSGAFNGESLNYSVEALRSGYPFSVFKKNKKYYDYADKIGRKAEIDPKTKKKKIIQVANQEEIANIAYDDDNRGKDYKLGNVNRGDGWKFRGRGLMQITGRSNYKSIQEIIDNRLPNSGIDLSVGKATFTAKEAVVSTLSVLMNTGTAQLGSVLPSLFTGLSAVSFLVFTLLYTPCVAAVATIKKELGSRIKTVGVVFMQCAVAYIASFIVYSVGGLFV